MINKRLFCCLVVLGLLTLFSCKKDNIPSDTLLAEALINDNKIPNFSFAGYRNSEESIPYVPVVTSLSAIEGDNYNLIQSAINQLALQPVDKNGFRGTILLKSGIYSVSEPIQIRANGIVLRGEGQEHGKTLIRSTKVYDTPQTTTNLQRQAVVSILGKAFQYRDVSKANSLIKKDVFMADKSLEVENIGGFSIGDTILITKTTNQAWIDFVGMQQYGWTPEEFQINHKRVISRIDSNRIHFMIPMVDDFRLEHGGGIVRVISHVGLIENCGIENIRIETVYENDEDENHLWNAVMLSRTNNCWVRNITAKHFSLSAVAIFYSENITVQDCAISEFKSKPIGDRRYPFFLDINCTRILFQRCYSEGGRHPLITGPRVAGPNVFLDCYNHNSISDTGPHNRWATGTLYDNIYSDLIYARNAENTMGHGWTGAYQMFWNNYAARGYMVQNPPGATNWLVGAIGSHFTLNTAESVSKGIRILPRSIFIEQLTKRVGMTLTKQIVSEKQLGHQNIWEDLKNWGGEGKPLVAIR